jgi:hypothetical protein
VTPSWGAVRGVPGKGPLRSACADIANFFEEKFDLDGEPGIMRVSDPHLLYAGGESFFPPTPEKKLKSFPLTSPTGELKVFASRVGPVENPGRG